jgi:hypothetical protein
VEQVPGGALHRREEIEEEVVGFRLKLRYLGKSEILKFLEISQLRKSAPVGMMMGSVRIPIRKYNGLRINLQLKSKRRNLANQIHSDQAMELQGGRSFSGRIISTCIRRRTWSFTATVLLLRQTAEEGYPLARNPKESSNFS